MANSRIRPKVRRRKVAQLAAYSRQFTVHNNTIPKTELNQKKLVTIWHEIPTARFDVSVYGKTFEIDKDGHYSLIEREFDPTPMFISDGRPKQPKPLRKKYKKKYYMKGSHEIRKIVEHASDYAQFKNYSHTMPKMNQAQYCEKLVEHKTAKWERKHPKPMDMFAEEVEKWKQLRETAIERFRDFVVSTYYKIKVYATVSKPGGPPYKEIPIGIVTDVKNAMQDAKVIAKEAMEKNPEILHCQIKDYSGNYRLVA